MSNLSVGARFSSYGWYVTHNATFGPDVRIDPTDNLIPVPNSFSRALGYLGGWLCSPLFIALDALFNSRKDEYHLSCTRELEALSVPISRKLIAGSLALKVIYTFANLLIGAFLFPIGLILKSIAMLFSYSIAEMSLNMQKAEKKSEITIEQTNRGIREARLRYQISELEKSTAKETGQIEQLTADFKSANNRALEIEKQKDERIAQLESTLHAVRNSTAVLRTEFENQEAAFELSMRELRTQQQTEAQIEIYSHTAADEAYATVNEQRRRQAAEAQLTVNLEITTELRAEVLQLKARLAEVESRADEHTTTTTKSAIRHASDSDASYASTTSDEDDDGSANVFPNLSMDGTSSHTSLLSDFTTPISLDEEDDSLMRGLSTAPSELQRNRTPIIDTQTGGIESGPKTIRRVASEATDRHSIVREQTRADLTPTPKSQLAATADVLGSVMLGLEENYYAGSLFRRFKSMTGYGTLKSTSEDGYGNTRLHHATRIGDINRIKALIADGATLSLNNLGQSPLHIAALNDTTGAVVNRLIQTDRGLTLSPLYQKLEEDCQKYKKQSSLSDKAKKTLIANRVSAYQVALVALRRDEMQLLKAQDQQGCTPLILAAQNIGSSALRCFAYLEPLKTVHYAGSRLIVEPLASSDAEHADDLICTTDNIGRNAAHIAMFARNMSGFVELIRIVSPQDCQRLLFSDSDETSMPSVVSIALRDNSLRDLYLPAILDTVADKGQAILSALYHEIFRIIGSSETTVLESMLLDDRDCLQMLVENMPVDCAEKWLQVIQEYAQTSRGDFIGDIGALGPAGLPFEYLTGEEGTASHDYLLNNILTMEVESGCSLITKILSENTDYDTPKALRTTLPLAETIVLQDFNLIEGIALKVKNPEALEAFFSKQVGSQGDITVAQMKQHLMRPAAQTGQTPVHLAATHNNRAFIAHVQTYENSHVVFQIKNQSGLSTPQVALVNGHIELALELCNDDIAALENLLNSKVPDALDRAEKTLLQLIASNPSVRILSVLLEHPSTAAETKRLAVFTNLISEQSTSLQCRALLREKVHTLDSRALRPGHAPLMQQYARFCVTEDDTALETATLASRTRRGSHGPLSVEEQDKIESQKEQEKNSGSRRKSG